MSNLHRHSAKLFAVRLIYLGTIVVTTVFKEFCKFFAFLLHSTVSS
jgi:hypothetical protein